MDWKYYAMDILKCYELNVSAAANIKDRLEELEAQCTAIRSAVGEDSPVSGGTNRREDMLLSNILERENLKQNYNICLSAIKRTERGLECLDEEEREILTGFYVRRSRGHIDRLCEDLHLEKSALYAKKDKALAKFTKAMYGIIEL